MIGVITTLLDHWSTVTLRSTDGDVKDVYIFVKVRDQHSDGLYFDHVRKFKVTALEEVERTSTSWVRPFVG